MDPGRLWLTIGFLGQALFFSRFLLQWLASERQHQSVIPLGFWYLSLGGGLMLLSYALHKHDPVFTLGQAFGAFVYTRNLWLIRRTRSGA